MSNMKKAVSLWLVSALAVLLAACGGGGGSAGTSPFGDNNSGTSVSDLSIGLSSQSVPNTGSDSVTATVTAVDGSRNAVAGVTVQFAVDNNAVATVNSGVTDASGQAVAVVGIGADRTNRIITVTASSGSLSKTASFQVTGSKIVATLVTTVAPNSANNVVRYRVSDVNSNPLVGVDVAVSAPGLPSATGVTGATGEYEFVYTAPAQSGALVITATAAGVTDINTVQVQSVDNSVPNAVGPVSSATVDANPNTVPVNTSGGNSNQAQVRALFVGAGNKAIANVRVRFDLKGDANNIGGTFVTGNTMLYSNANGLVTSAYVPGTRSSPTDGVTIRACWDYADFAANTCPNEAIKTLTVTAEPLSVTIGTNELIEEGTEKLTYIRNFVVMVVNSAGVAMQNVNISPVLDLTGYRKGYWQPVGGKWQKQETASCTNEDINRNGILDAPVGGYNEDVNGNGAIDPRKADAAVSFVGSTTTNENGMVFLKLVYPKDKASWVDYRITVAATGIAGTEGVANHSGVLDVPAAAVNSTDSTPAFVVSPYGYAAVCSNPN
jgi:hypothetical protein